MTFTNKQGKQYSGPKLWLVEHRNALHTKENTPLEANRAALPLQGVAGGPGPGVDAATGAAVAGGRVSIATQQHGLSLEK